MQVQKIKTDRGNKYIYSENTQHFHFLPPQMEKYLNGTLPVDESDYYGKKYLFWKEKILQKGPSVELVTDYTPESIENNLANLRQFVIEVTDGCNLKCKYCGYGEIYTNYDPRLNKKLSFSEVKRFIDYLSDLWTSDKNISYNIVSIGFYGGEPLLNFPLIRQTIAYLESLSIKDMQFTFNMTTNGMLLDKYMDYLVEKNFMLLISMDGNKLNNSYRITRSNRSSFPKVFANAKLLQEKHPEYFKKNVEFNAVLHDKNSAEELYYFFKNHFDKRVKIAELNTSNIAEGKKEEFLRLYRSMEESLKASRKYETLKKAYELSEVNILTYRHFIDTFCGNYFEYAADLLQPEKTTFIPTGTCPPFRRKVMLTVNGKLLPCEKIGQNYPLGQITENSVEIDYEKIRDIYAAFYKKTKDQCSQCAMWKSCGQCVYFLEEKDGKLLCPGFISSQKANLYFARFLSHTEEEPEFYVNATKEVITD